MTNRADLLPGTLDTLVLKAVSLGATHGYGVLLRIEEMTEGAILVEQGALYPVLRSLEAGGLLESRVEPSVSGPPRRYYQITQAGKHMLEQWIETWERTREFVERSIRGDGDV